LTETAPLPAIGHAPSLVLFDCDGTLVDSQQAIVAAMAAAFAAAGLAAPAPEAVRRVVGLSLGEAMAALMPGADAPTHLRLADRYRTAFAESRLQGQPQGTLFPGAVPAVEALVRRGHVLGIATGKSRRGLVATLERFGLAGRFTTLQTADDAPSKPHPAMVRQAMDATGAEPAATVVVGDTTFDMEMAVAAGARAVGVAWGYHDVADLHAAGAALVVQGFDSLPDRIDALLGVAAA